MRILILCYEYPPVGGGGGRMAQGVAAKLAARGHELRVQTAGLKGLPACERRDGVDIFRTPSFRRHADRCTVPEMAAYIITSFLPALGHIRRWKPDIIHAHFAVPTGALALACRLLTGTPYVLTAHLGDLPGGNPDQTDTLFRFLNPAIRPVWKNAAAITASSSFSAGLARTAYGAEPRIILNGVDMKGRAEAPRTPSSPTELVAIGRFNPQKNFPWMIRALAGCEASWRLTLIGDGSQRGEVEAAIRETGLGPRIHLAGWTTEDAMRDVLSRSDILLMPSTSEGNPVAAVEALKQGLAVLGSDIGGLSDLIEDGGNGFAVPLGSPEMFRSRLVQLTSDTALLTAMKRRSLQMAEKFDLDSIAGEFESLLANAARK